MLFPCLHDPLNYNYYESIRAYLILFVLKLIFSSKFYFEVRFFFFFIYFESHFLLVMHSINTHVSVCLKKKTYRKISVMFISPFTYGTPTISHIPSQQSARKCRVCRVSGKTGSIFILGLTNKKYLKKKSPHAVKFILSKFSLQLTI